MASGRNVCRPFRPAPGSKLCNRILQDVRQPHAAPNTQRPRGNHSRRGLRSTAWWRARQTCSLGVTRRLVRSRRWITFAGLTWKLNDHVVLTHLAGYAVKWSAADDESSVKISKGRRVSPAVFVVGGFILDLKLRNPIALAISSSSELATRCSVLRSPPAGDYCDRRAASISTRSTSVSPRTK